MGFNSGFKGLNKRRKSHVILKTELKTVANSVMLQLYIYFFMYKAFSVFYVFTI